MGADHPGKPAPGRNRTGAFLIDKPAGMTSHRVIDTLRKLTGIKKAGHTGTLDPFATGLLPVLLGKTTRLSRFLTESDKTYFCVVDLSYGTDTYDIDGKRTTPLFTEYPDRTHIEKILSSLVGTHRQVPPMFSAKKMGGKKLYALARRGIEVPREPVSVTISSISLVSCHRSFITILARCSPGTYMRSLAHDIGRKLGGAAHLACLRRVETGGFHIKSAMSLDELEQRKKAGTLWNQLVPPEKMLAYLPFLVLSAAGEKDFSHGRPVLSRDVIEKGGSGRGRPSSPFRVFNTAKVFIGLAERSPDRGGKPDRKVSYQPSVVLI